MLAHKFLGLCKTGFTVRPERVEGSNGMIDEVAHGEPHSCPW
jgi:hypothetical protein